MHHDYSDKHVSLYFYLVKQFSGVAKGLEGQPLEWVDAQTLSEMVIPEANRPIAEALLAAWPAHQITD